MNELLLFERFDERGGTEKTMLVAHPEGPRLRIGGDEYALPPGAIDAVMKRYGKPLDPTVAGSLPAGHDSRFHLGDGRTACTFRHLARYDVIAKDFVAYAAPGEEPLCELATAVAGALTHLALAAARVSR